MKAVWKRIINWLKVNSVDIYNDLNPGITEIEISEAESKFEVELPKSYRQSLKICNGQLGLKANLLGEWQLLSLRATIAEWNGLNKLFLKKHESLDYQDEEKETPWWNRKWIPIGYNGAGDFLCMDLSQKWKKDRGRIIQFWHTHEQRNVHSSSFKKLLQDFAEDLNSNNYIYQEDQLNRINDSKME